MPNIVNKCWVWSRKNEAFDLRLRNPLILNGIDFDPVFPDLRDRCIFISLKQLKERKSKHELEEKFDAIRPQRLGALLDAVVSALSNTKYRLERDIGFRMLYTAEFAMKAADARLYNKVCKSKKYRKLT